MRDGLGFRLPFVIDGVSRITRPGLGAVYRGEIAILELYQLLLGDKLKYAPKYQRGYKGTGEDIDESLYDRLLPLDAPELQIDWKRCQEMAVKYLRGELFNSEVTWNARRVRNRECLHFDDGSRTLTIDLMFTKITIPDSGHRHGCYYTLGKWFEDTSTIPEIVEVERVPVKRDTIRHLMKNFSEDQAVHVDIYHLLPEQEGKLFDEFNTKGKKVPSAQSIGVNMEGTPTRRFLGTLMEATGILSPREIEMHRNSVGGKSRKLTSVATLEGALRPHQTLLVSLENQRPMYDNLVKFVATFFEEWASHFSAWQPEATAEQRHSFREESFALSNVIFHPLFTMAIKLWEEYRNTGVDWSTSSDWKVALARIAGKTDAVIDGALSKVDVMSRKNPQWVGKIVLESIAEDGSRRYSVTNNKPAHAAAYNYLCEVAGLDPKAGGKRTKDGSRRTSGRTSK